MITDASQLNKQDACRATHAECFVCGSQNEHGLQLRFSKDDAGKVSAKFNCRRAFAGYPGVLHGGIISSLFDSAMVNCLFEQGRTAVTAQLTVRFRHPVVIEENAVVEAWVTRSCCSLHEVKAELKQNGKVKAVATGKFLDQPQLLTTASEK